MIIKTLCGHVGIVSDLSHSSVVGRDFAHALLANVERGHLDNSEIYFKPHLSQRARSLER